MAKQTNYFYLQVYIIGTADIIKDVTKNNDNNIKNARTLSGFPTLKGLRHNPERWERELRLWGFNL